MEAYINQCLTIVKSRDKEKAAAFVCIGLLTIACRPASIGLISKILDAVRAALPTRVGPHLLINNCSIYCTVIIYNRAFCRFIYSADRNINHK